MSHAVTLVTDDPNRGPSAMLLHLALTLDHSRTSSPAPDS
jgi:hypothetical protein